MSQDGGPSPWRCRPPQALCANALPAPLPTAHSRKASFPEQRVPVSWGSAEEVKNLLNRAHYAGRLQLRGLPQGRVCPGMACGRLRVRRGPLQRQGQGSQTCFSQSLLVTETCVKTDP